MKKRLLITSIVMMLVVAVALSTATYAWFTSATQVTASSITMTAGTSASSALGIAWSAGSSGSGFNAHYSTTITAAAPSTEQSNGFQPAAPAALTSSQPVFNTAYVNAQGAFTAAGAPTDVYRFNDGVSGNTSNVIHVANLAASGTTGVRLTATIGDTTTDAEDLIRIAVFEVSGDTFSTYAFKGVISKVAAEQGTNNTAVGSITANLSAATLVSTTGTASVTSIDLCNIDAQTEKTFAVYVWLDGALFNEARSGDAADVSLTFSAIPEIQ